MLYLDHAATSPLLPEVKKAMTEAMEELFGNAAAIHTPGHLAHECVEDARKTVAKLINAKPGEIIFTSGATEGNNAVMHTFAGKNIAVSPFEHPSVIKPAQKYAKKVTEKDAKLFSTQLANQEIGTIFPVAELAKQSHDNNAYFHTDATQAISKIPIDVKKLGIDYLTFSAHKSGGPTGVGVLYVKDGAPFKPLMLGGHQENGRRAGTHNTVGIIGLATAADYVIKNDTPAIYEKRIRPLRDLLEKRILTEIQGSEVNKQNGHVSLPNILNISFKGAEGESIQLMLDNAGVVVSTGSACASTDGKPSPVLMALHGDAEIAHSSIRFSLGLDTTKKDIDRVMSVLPSIIKKLQGISTV